MTDQATRVVPAGWYDDPASPSRVRWWNGIAWTEHVADKPSPEEQAAAAERAAREAEEAANAARIAEVRRLELEFGISTNEVPVVGWVRGDGGRGASGAGELRRDRSNRRPPNPATGAMWLIALSPLLTLVLAAAAAYVYLYLTPTPMLALVLIVPYALTLLWAFRDARTLRDRDYDPPHPLWALLGGLGYLIARRLRVHGASGLVTFAALAVVALGVPGVAWATGALAPISTGIAIHGELSAELQAQGATGISCPLWLTSTEPGHVYTCEATVDGETRELWVALGTRAGDYSWAWAVD